MRGDSVQCRLAQSLPLLASPEGSMGAGARNPGQRAAGFGVAGREEVFGCWQDWGHWAINASWGGAEETPGHLPSTAG